MKGISKFSVIKKKQTKIQNAIESNNRALNTICCSTWNRISFMQANEIPNIKSRSKSKNRVRHSFQRITFNFFSSFWFSSSVVSCLWFSILSYTFFSDIKDHAKLRTHTSNLKQLFSIGYQSCIWTRKKRRKTDSLTLLNCCHMKCWNKYQANRIHWKQFEHIRVVNTSTSAYNVGIASFSAVPDFACLLALYLYSIYEYIHIDQQPIYIHRMIWA